MKTEWNAATLRALREQFTYAPVTGDITRKSNGRTLSKRPSGNGYSQAECTIGGKRFACTQHALAWFIHHGWMPIKLDHENGIKTDNSITNLRASNNSHNQLNRHKKVGRYQHLPIGIYERVRRGRPGIWYECRIQFGSITKSTLRRDKDRAIAYIAEHRARFLQLAAP